MARSPRAIEYRPAVITFVGILGFHEIVRERSASEVQAILPSHPKLRRP